VDVDPRTHAAVCLDARGLGLELVPLLGAETPDVEIATGSPEPPRGWISMNGTDMPATACRYTVQATLPLTMIWLLLPLSGWQRVGATGKRTDRAEGDILVEFATPGGRKDVLTFPHPLAVGAQITAKKMQRGVCLQADFQRQK